MNVRTVAGAVVRAQPELIGLVPINYCSYLTYVMGSDYSVCLGVGKEDTGEWYPFDGTASFTNMYSGANVHISISVSGHNIAFVITNKSSGATVYSSTYTLGGKVRYDPLWFDGTFGLCMLIKDSSGTQVNANNAYFDNLVVTAIKDTPDVGFSGDVNGDGRVTVSDVLKLVKDILDGTSSLAHDMNGDEKISLIYALRIMKK